MSYRSMSRFGISIKMYTHVKKLSLWAQSSELDYERRARITIQRGMVERPMLCDHLTGRMPVIVAS